MRAERLAAARILSDMTTNPKSHADDSKTKRETPPAGPHDKPELTDPAKTPGTGVLPEKDAPTVDGPTG
jgi:hypothetical protein